MRTSIDTAKNIGMIHENFMGTEQNEFLLVDNDIDKLIVNIRNILNIVKAAAILEKKKVKWIIEEIDNCDGFKLRSKHVYLINRKLVKKTK